MNTSVILFSIHVLFTHNEQKKVIIIVQKIIDYTNYKLLDYFILLELNKN